MSKCALPEPVETTGSAWIICRSKTYINRPYYFNTLTGHAVWNLSEAEMEKARRAQKNFEKLSFSSDACPEPEGSPEHTLPNTINPNNDRMMRPKKVYNKQVINNRFTRTTNYSPINAMPMGIAVPTLYNPLIWNVPPQPVVLGPFNQPDYSISSHINTQMPVSETSVPLSKRFSSYTETQNIQPTLYMNTQNICRFTKRSSAGTSMNSVNRFKDNVDLREKLSARRRSFGNFESHQNEVEEAYEPAIYQNEETLLNMKDEDWLAKNLQENPYSIDTSTLKQLVNVEDDTGFWYIITDTIVLLSNTNFLRVLLNDDKQCNLILPQAVFAEIETISKSNPNPQAKQALAFISQQIILNQAFIDQETTNSLYIQDEILGCCSRISEQGYPVILISNNVEMLHLKETDTYQILTMREFKKHACRPTESVKKYLPLNDIEPNIKITIANELNEPPSKHQTKYIITDNGVDQPIIQSAVSLEDETNDIDLPVTCQGKDKTHDDDLINTINTDEKDTPFPRKLKLNRQISHDNSKITSSNIKNFKWRRKSNTKHNLNELNKFENENANTNAHQHSGSNINEANIDIKINNAENVNITDSSHDTNDKADDDDVIFIKTEPLSPKYNASAFRDDKNVMFEITSENMEENLKLKCDEWVSRFIQIMEEVLTQVLHREPKYVCDAIPPPWTLYEATECTRKKFHSDSDIVDAANKLRNILFDIGGSRGECFFK